MSVLYPCECGGREVWFVERAVEHGRDGWNALGRLDGVAPMSMAICFACGRVAWRATPGGRADERPTPTPARRIVDERLSCRDCDGRSHVLVAMLREETTRRGAPLQPLRVVRGEFLDAGGRFALVVCERCGRAEWFACDVGGLDGVACAGACGRCSARALRSVRPFCEERRSAAGGRRARHAVRRARAALVQRMRAVRLARARRGRAGARAPADGAAAHAGDQRRRAVPMSGWSVHAVRGRLACARCGEERGGCSLAANAVAALECAACGGCEWFHIQDERPALEADAGGPYR